MFNKKLTSYYEVPSLIHSINPVIKIICTIILGIISNQNNNTDIDEILKRVKEEFE